MRRERLIHRIFPGNQMYNGFQLPAKNFVLALLKVHSRHPALTDEPMPMKSDPLLQEARDVRGDIVVEGRMPIRLCPCA